MLTIDELVEALHYDADTGIFKHRHNVRRVKAGDIAGYRDALGYIRITIAGKRYQAADLAWFYINGVMPDMTIDHIDRNPSNNAINNLRHVSRSFNQTNRQGWSKLPKGVAKHSSGRYRAQLGYRYTIIGLGTYDTPEQAHQAYLAGRKIYYGY